LRLALFEPDIPQNAGTLMRLCACLGAPIDIIEPCGFALTDKNMKRAAMDYLARLDMMRHTGWTAFQSAHPGARRVLMTTRSAQPFTAFAFRPGDILIAGRESAGVPEHVHAACDARLVVPMAADMRSLNVAVAAAMVLGEALRQTALYPKTTS
jgi:tRNA (cytidine/uridine-2'-O-)-methyltransferase